MTRSISGLRAKDVEKVARISHHVFTNCPDVRAWIHDGPGRDTFDLARILHTLRQRRRDPQTLRIGNLLTISPCRLADLVDHDSFMATELRPVWQRAIVEAAHAKSTVLGTYEAKPSVVTFWQNHIEHRLDRVLHNEPTSSKT